MGKRSGSAKAWRAVAKSASKLVPTTVQLPTAMEAMGSGASDCRWSR